MVLFTPSCVGCGQESGLFLHSLFSEIGGDVRTAGAGRAIRPGSNHAAAPLPSQTVGGRNKLGDRIDRFAAGVWGIGQPQGLRDTPAILPISRSRSQFTRNPMNRGRTPILHFDARDSVRTGQSPLRNTYFSAPPGIARIRISSGEQHFVEPEPARPEFQVATTSSVTDFLHST